MLSVLVQQEVLDGLGQRQGGHAAYAAFAHRSADPDTAQMRQPPRGSCQEGEKKKRQLQQHMKSAKHLTGRLIETATTLRRVFKNGSFEFKGTTRSRAEIHWHAE